jgi:hypothetical protein
MNKPGLTRRTAPLELAIGVVRTTTDVTGNTRGQV